MAYKLIRLLDGGEDASAMKGVPFPTGVEFEIETHEDRIAAKLLKFIDGSKSLQQLIEDLPLSTRQLGEVISRLYDLGAIAFDQEYCNHCLIEDDEPQAASSPEAPASPTPEPRKEDVKETGKKINIEIVEEGSLEEIPLWQRFNQLERKLFTGRVSVNTQDCHREFYFLNGSLTYATSDHRDEEIGSLLMKKKKISQMQYDSYRKEMGKRGKDPFRILVDLGAFPGHQKLMAQRWAGQVVAYNVLIEKKGTFIIEKWDRLPNEVPKLGLNFKGIMERFMEESLPVDEEAEKLKEKNDWWLAPVTEQLDRSLSEKEQRLWDIIVERPRRLRDIMTLTTLYRRDTYRFIFMLLTSGYVEMVKKPPEEEGPIDLRNLDEFVETIMESNYFDVLTVHPVSDTEDIKKAYGRIMPKLNLSAYRELTEDQKTKFLKVKQRVEEAWKTLKEETTRRDYRRKIFSDYQLRQYAQLQYQKAEIYLWWRHDPVRAREYFTSSKDLDPTNQVYWAAYAYSVVSSPHPDTGATSEAMKLVEKVAGTSSDPTALVFAGGAFIRAGKRKAAESMFEKARKAGAESAGISSMINIIMTREGGGAADRGL